MSGGSGACLESVCGEVCFCGIACNELKQIVTYLVIGEEPPMNQEITALLVHGQEQNFNALNEVLESQSVKAIYVMTCSDAEHFFKKAVPPHLVFPDMALPDGTWADVLEMANKALAPVNVIVMSRLPELHWYLEVLNCGAFDFITPPFDTSALVYGVRHAIQNCLSRRKACGHPA